jgi:hypothetical protein
MMPFFIPSGAIRLPVIISAREMAAPAQRLKRLKPPNFLVSFIV